MSAASSDSSDHGDDVEILESPDVVRTDADECGVCMQAPANGMVAVIPECLHYFCGSCVKKLHECPLCRAGFAASKCVVKPLAEVKVLAERFADESARLTAAEAALVSAQTNFTSTQADTIRFAASLDTAKNDHTEAIRKVLECRNILSDMCNVMKTSDHVSNSSLVWLQSEFAAKTEIARVTLERASNEWAPHVIAKTKYLEARNELAVKDVALALATRAVNDARKALLAPPADTSASSGRKRKL
jgi:hypothetical protein